MTPKEKEITSGIKTIKRSPALLIVFCLKKYCKRKKKKRGVNNVA
jgi:hypothetical protein